jgi:uncharacterized protein YjiS (DUF1127 family)
MPTVDLLLPPRTCSPWRANRRREPWPVITFAAVSRIALWIECVRQRRMLSELDDHMLRDIGVTRVEAARECEKPFWR